MKLRLITVVWGKGFTDVFLRVTVRSLLSEGNLAALAARHEIVHTIHTTEEDARVLRASPVFQRLTAAAPVEIAVFDSSEIDLNNPSSHWILWRRAAEAAKRNHETVFFIIPDMLFGIGTLLRWAAVFEQGYRAICMASPQVVLETTLDEIERAFPQDRQLSISLTVAQIHELMLRQLHPLMIAMYRDSPRWMRHPDTLLAAVPGNGVVMRILASQPFCIDLNHFEVNDTFCPLDRLDDIAFEQPTTVCLEAMLKYPDMYYRPARLTDARLSNMGSWSDYHLGPTDVLWASHDARFVGRAYVDEAAFRRTEMSLDFCLEQIRLTAAIYRVVQAIRLAGCNVAAQVAATAHYAARLRRHWKIKGSITVFAPVDDGFARMPPLALDALVAPGNEKSLLDAVFAHIAPGKHVLSVGDALALATGDEPCIVEAANGAAHRVNRHAPGARILAGPIEVDDCTLYVVDRPLIVPKLRAARAERRVLPNSWTVNPSRRMVGLFESASQLAPPPAAPPPPPQLTRRLLRLGYRTMLALPVARRFAPRLAEAYRAVKRRRAAMNASMLSPAPVVTPQQEASKVPGAALDQLRDVRAAKIVLNLTELLRLHRDKMHGLAGGLPPLALAEACLERAGITADILADRLRALVAEFPEFAEAWLELGYCELDRGKFAEAVSNFERCLAASSAIAGPANTMGCHAQAALAKAAALEELDESEAAVEAYAAAFALDGSAYMSRIAHGNLLRGLGRTRDALADFATGMLSDVSAVGLPAMPRQFGDLADRLVARFAAPADRVPPR